LKLPDPLHDALNELEAQWQARASSDRGAELCRLSALVVRHRMVLETFLGAQTYAALVLAVARFTHSERQICRNELGRGD